MFPLAFAAERRYVRRIWSSGSASTTRPCCAAMIRLFPVIEVPYECSSLWLYLPPKPWPQFIELSGAATVNHVALALATLTTYGHSGTPPRSPLALAKEFPTVAPGGLAISDGLTTI